MSDETFEADIIIRNAEIKEIYDVEIDGVSTSFHKKGTSVGFDSDGDVTIYISVSETDLLDNMDEDTIIEYLTEKGYTVKEDE